MFEEFSSVLDELSSLVCSVPVYTAVKTIDFIVGVISSGEICDKDDFIPFNFVELLISGITIEVKVLTVEISSTSTSYSKAFPRLTYRRI